jgi:hypothetical protein
MKQKEFNQKWYGTVLSTMIALFLMGAGLFSGVHAQVTIGSGKLPADGALLDVKQQDAPNGGETSTKGVLFPRVSLTALNSLSPLVDNASDASKATHKGIVVYNVSNNLKEGLYCWDGAKWVCISHAWEREGNAGTDPDQNYIGTSDAKALSIRTDAKERIRVDENGKTYLTKVDPMSSPDVSQLVLDNKTGEISTLVTGKNTKALNYIVYEIECDDKNGNQDWIEDFDTKIETKDFTLVVVGSAFEPKIPNSGLAMGDKPAGVTASNNGTFSSSAVFAHDETKSGTWHLKADYVAGKPVDGKAGTWIIYCLAINNSMVQEVPITNGNYKDEFNNANPKKFKMDKDQNTGKADAPPAGLYNQNN